MAKSKKKYRRTQNNLIPVIPLAIGLLLIGFALSTLKPILAESNNNATNSVVPMKVNYAAPELSLQTMTDYIEANLRLRDKDEENLNKMAPD